MSVVQLNLLYNGFMLERVTKEELLGIIAALDIDGNEKTTALWTRLRDQIQELGI